MSGGPIIDKYISASKYVKEIISSSDANRMYDNGKVMGPIMGKLQGKADGKIVNQIVREELSWWVLLYLIFGSV